jgi:hypothetical protein
MFHVFFTKIQYRTLILYRIVGALSILGLIITVKYTVYCQIECFCNFQDPTLFTETVEINIDLVKIGCIKES